MCGGTHGTHKVSGYSVELILLATDPSLNHYDPEYQGMGNVSKFLSNPGSTVSVPSFPALTNEGDNRIFGRAKRLGRNMKQPTDMRNDVKGVGGVQNKHGGFPIGCPVLMVTRHWEKPCSCCPSLRSICEVWGSLMTFFSCLTNFNLYK